MVPPLPSRLCGAGDGISSELAARPRLATAAARAWPGHGYAERLNGAVTAAGRTDRAEGHADKHGRGTGLQGLTQMQSVREGGFWFAAPGLRHVACGAMVRSLYMCSKAHAAASKACQSVWRFARDCWESREPLRSGHALPQAEARWGGPARA